MSHRRNQHRVILLALILLLGMSASGCSWFSTTNEISTIADVPITIVPAPTGSYGRLAWIDDWIIIELNPLTAPTAFASRLWRLHPDGSNAEQLAIPEHSGCDRQGFQSPARLPNNQLGYIVRCFPKQESAAADLYMMAYDMHVGQVTSILSYSLPSQQIGTGGYSWRPDMTRGITSDGNGRGLSEQLYWLNQDRSEAINTGMPQSFAATWSPDGKQIAFMGAREQGLSGMARTNALFELYLMEQDGTQTHPLVAGLYYVASMAWSPDSRWIVFSASLTKDRQDKGLWLVEVATGKYRRIADGDFASPVWSPDGRRLAAVQDTGEYPNEKQYLVTVEIESLLQTR
jgi:WD40 repeat protein